MSDDNSQANTCAKHGGRDGQGDDTESTNPRDRSGETAGVVRGVSRSIFRAPIGHLPRQGRAVLTRQRLPLRRVARISDRVSTGLDWLNTAAETGGKDRLAVRVRRFGASLVRNTLMGLAVFESYGYLVAALAPEAGEPLGTATGAAAGARATADSFATSPVCVGEVVDDGSDDLDAFAAGPDEYARASLAVHFVAGGVAGSFHGIISSVLEGQLLMATKYTLCNTLHHSIAHSLLFGSYESIKRAALHQIHAADDHTQYYGGAYLLTFVVSGGLAGQLQHCTSHCTEFWLGLSNDTLKLSFRLPSVPTLRPLLWSFPPSAIGFVAFEYGKKFAA